MCLEAKKDMRRLDLTGQRFERWRVLRRARGREHGRSYWLCLCLCSRKRIVHGSSLVQGTSKSCGCLTRETTHLRTYKHGHSNPHTPTYRTWCDMRRRCTNPNRSDAYLYSARGIKFCKRWNNFANFLADMGVRPGRGYSIDRINNDGNYEPSNCRWATAHEQRMNQRPRRRKVV